MNFEQVKQQEQANMMHTYGRFPVALVKGKGVTRLGYRRKRLHRFHQRYRRKCAGLV